MTTPGPSITVLTLPVSNQRQVFVSFLTLFWLSGTFARISAATLWSDKWTGERMKECFMRLLAAGLYWKEPRSGSIQTPRNTDWVLDTILWHLQTDCIQESSGKAFWVFLEWFTCKYSQGQGRRCTRTVAYKCLLNIFGVCLSHTPYLVKCHYLSSVSRSLAFWKF